MLHKNYGNITFYLVIKNLILQLFLINEKIFMINSKPQKHTASTSSRHKKSVNLLI